MKKSNEQFSMPKEVKEWIEEAGSRIKFLTQQVDKLKEENKALKADNKRMQIRVMGTSRED